MGRKEGAAELNKNKVGQQDRTTPSAYIGSIQRGHCRQRADSLSPSPYKHTIFLNVQSVEGKRGGCGPH